MKVAVVGHHEWVTFAAVPAVPAPGEIVHATEWYTEPGGGGSGAAVQMVKLAGEAAFFTAFGGDEVGRRAAEKLRGYGLVVHATFRDEPTRQAFTHIDADGERTITVLGERLAPRGSDPLPWEEINDALAVYFTAGDAEALRHARAAQVLVATPRAGRVLAEAGVQLDALVGSAADPDESYERGRISPEPHLVVMTEGASGGTFFRPGGVPERFSAPAPPGEVVDRYGAGDSFAAGLAVGLGAGFEVHAALVLAARCGAAVITGRGPYAAQLQERVAGGAQTGI